LAAVGCNGLSGTIWFVPSDLYYRLECLFALFNMTFSGSQCMVTKQCRIR